MTINILISLMYLLLLGLTVVGGRYADRNTDAPLIYYSTIVQFILNISVILFFVSSVFLAFFNWHLLLLLLLIGFLFVPNRFQLPYQWITVGLISGVWLLYLGYWKLLLHSSFVSFMMPYVYVILSLPTYALQKLLTKLEKRKSRSLIPLGILIALYEKTIIFIWLLLVFSIIVPDNWTGISTLPFILWGYAIAMYPVSRMSRSEGQDPGVATALGTRMVQISYLLIVIFYFLKLPPFIIYGIPLIVSLGIAVYPPVFILPNLIRNNE